jgi:hypothetical protein
VPLDSHDMAPAPASGSEQRDGAIDASTGGTSLGRRAAGGRTPGRSSFADMDRVVIASRLSDGRVVFLSAAPGVARGEWRLRLDEASIASDDVRAKELLALGEASAREEHRVVEPYLIEVERSVAGLQPTVYRERIRCLGPTVRTDLGKQAEAREV